MLIKLLLLPYSRSILFSTDSFLFFQNIFLSSEFNQMLIFNSITKTTITIYTSNLKCSQLKSYLREKISILAMKFPVLRIFIIKFKLDSLMHALMGYKLDMKVK
jgi:hypothetical protein